MVGKHTPENRQNTKSAFSLFPGVSGDVGRIICSPNGWTADYLGARPANQLSEGSFFRRLNERHVRDDHPQVEIFDGADIPRVFDDHCERRFFAFNPAASCIGI